MKPARGLVESFVPTLEDMRVEERDLADHRLDVPPLREVGKDPRVTANFSRPSRHNRADSTDGLIRTNCVGRATCGRGGA
jgi:hypothetical protein